MLYGLTINANAEIPQVKEQPSTTEPTSPEETVITSDHFEMQSGDSETTFLFTGNVIVIGTDLQASCEKMQVFSESSGNNDAPIGEVGKISYVIMLNNVVIEQAGRKATSERADLYPQEGKVVLTENPKVVDVDGTMTGYKMTLFNGEKRVLVESDPNGERPRLVLPNMPEIGYKSTNNDNNTAPTDKT
jgi:lipopolysaccharide transport protein LptA